MFKPKLILAVELSSDPWPTFAHDDQRTSRSNLLGPTFPVVKWIYTDYNASGNNHAVDSQGNVYVGTGADGNVFYSLNTNGEKRWEYNYGSGYRSWTFPVLTNDNQLLFSRRSACTDTKFLSLNPTSGSLNWQSDSINTFGTSCGGLHVGMAIADNKVWAISHGAATVGVDVLDGGLFHLASWPGYSGIGTATSVSQSKDKIYFITNNGQLRAYKPDGNLAWSKTSLGTTYGSPSVAENGDIYVANNSGVLYSINPTNGDTNWTYSSCGSNSYSTPSIGSDGTVYYSSFSDLVVCAITPNGNLKWEKSLGGTLSAYHSSEDRKQAISIDRDGSLYIPESQRIYKLNSANGEVIWTAKYSSRNTIAIGPNKSLYFASYYLGYVEDLEVEIEVDNHNGSPGEDIQVKATTNLPKRSPNATSDNQIQVIMNDEEKVPLNYIADSGSNTMWQGTYTIPTKTTSKAYTARVEIMAYNVSTNTNTNFSSTPTGFDNTGFVKSFCYGVKTETVNCGSNSIVNLNVEVTENTGKITWDTTEMSKLKIQWGATTDMQNIYEDSLGMKYNHEYIIDNLKPDSTYYFRIYAESGNGITNTGIKTFNTKGNIPNGWVKPITLRVFDKLFLESEQEVNSFLWFSKPHIIPFDSYITFDNLGNFESLISNNEFANITNPKNNDLKLTGDIHYVQAFSSFNGAKYSKMLDPYTISLSFDESYKDKKINIAWYDSQYSVWRLLPYTIIKSQTQQVIVATDKTGFFAPVILN